MWHEIGGNMAKKVEKLLKSSIVDGCWIEERKVDGCWIGDVFLCIGNEKKKDLYVKRIKISYTDWKVIVKFKKIVDREVEGENIYYGNHALKERNI